MFGTYHIFVFRGKALTFIECPSCGHLTHIPGRLKPNKARHCFGCDLEFIEPTTRVGVKVYEVHNADSGL
jgi:ribosomal protein L32